MTKRNKIFAEVFRIIMVKERAMKLRIFRTMILKNGME